MLRRNAKKRRGGGVIAETETERSAGYVLVPLKVDEVRARAAMNSALSGVL